MARCWRPVSYTHLDVYKRQAFQNAKANTPHTARLAHDQALGKAAQGSMKDFTQFYKQFVENESFKRFVGDMVFALSLIHI